MARAPNLQFVKKCALRVRRLTSILSLFCGEHGGRQLLKMIAEI